MQTIRSQRPFSVAFAAIMSLGLAVSPNGVAADLDSEQWLELGIDPEEISTGPEAADDNFSSPVRGASIVRAFSIVQEGNTPVGLSGPVESLNTPFTNGLGEVGFLGRASDGMGDLEVFIWIGTGVAFVDSSVNTPILTGGEQTIGIGDLGQFIYSPSIDGSDSVWTNNGLLLVEETQAPGFPKGTISTFHSRPTMSPGGASFWVSGFNESGGTSTEGRILYRSDDSTPGSVEVVLRSDDLIDGLAIDRPSGIDFDYDFSANGENLISVLRMDTGSSADDAAVYVNGSLIARESFASGSGDNWSAFDSVNINDSGVFAFSGNTDAASTISEFIAVNGTIVVREGESLGGVTLTSPATVRALALNNLDQLVHLWQTDATLEVLFFSCLAMNAGSTSIPVLATGDQVDLDGDGIGDATVTDFNASASVGPGLSLAENGVVHVEVDLDFGGGELETNIQLPLPACVDGIFADRFQSG